MKILLTFTFKYSLKTWENAGILERELNYYQKISEKYGVNYVFLTYGDETESYFLSDYPNIEIIPMFKYIKHTNNKYFLFLKTLTLPLLIRRELKEVSVVKTNQLNGAWLAILIKIMFRKPLFIRTGYDALIFSIKNNKPITKRILFYFLTQLSLMTSNLYTVSSKDDFEFIKKNYLFKKSKLKIRHNWVLDNYKVDFTNRESKKIISIGRLVPQKNYKYLIKEFSNSDQIIDIVGEGPDKESLQELAIKHNTNINFLGNLRHENLMNIMNQYRYFISSSLFEGNPKAILEAMASGCLVLAVDIPNNSEVIKNNENGLLYQLEKDNLLNTFNEILLNEELSKTLSTNALKTVEANFSINKMINDEYSDLVSLSK